MNGEASWLTVAILLFGLLGIGMLAAVGTQIGMKLRAVRRRVQCPRGRECECVLLQNPSDGHWVDVAACSAFDDPERVTCKRRCLERVAALG
jgi:hypothetical protein